MSETDAAIDSALLGRRLDRVNRKVAILEEMIEDKTRNLYLTQEASRVESEFLAGVLSRM
jgi:hypothetical protein